MNSQNKAFIMFLLDFFYIQLLVVTNKKNEKMELIVVNGYLRLGKFRFI